ncbi:MAG: discoidin domain-containing protein [Spirochaetales bacterium]|nr:discoidin domain-containing protein [Spirochaetales bacterium]
MMRFTRPCVLLCFMLVSCVHIDPVPVATAPGRPRLGDGTVLTDRGTRLRGVYWSLDMAGELPDRESVREIRDFGLNTLHVYAERHDSGVPAGSYVNRMDTIVKWCGEDGLYCVITIGCGGRNGSFDLDFARVFWNTYAPRYKDKPWVIYEIYNEPYAGWTAPYDDKTLAMEQEMYDLIRRRAPRTMFLLFSYSGALTVTHVRHDMDRLKVDWTNAAVAFHAYGGLVDKALPSLKAAGITAVCTELSISSPFSDEQVNACSIDTCEKNGISWLVFMEIKEGYLAGWRFKKEIDKRRLGWQPDFGTWPSGPSACVPPRDLALGRKTVVSSVENFQGKDLRGEYATDGDQTTRWGSAFAGDQYIIVDLGKAARFDTIVVHWDGQYAVEYEVLVSDDGERWRLIYSEHNGNGGDFSVYNKERIHAAATARSVKLFLKKRRMQYGFSMYELQIFDTTEEVLPPTGH